MKEETVAALKLVTKELAEADAAEKKAKTKKESARKKFLELCTQAVVEDRPLRKLTVDVPREDLIGNDGETELLESWRLKEYPEWKILDYTKEVASYVYLVTIEEDPALTKFSFVNEDLKKVFGRTTETRGAYFDSESMRTFVFADDEMRAILSGAYKEKTIYEFDELHAQLVLSLHPELMPLFQRHSHPGTLSTKLTPIRTAKEEEVE